MKNKKIIFVIIFAIFIILLLTTKSDASLFLNSLEFYAEIDENGNMNVTETWDIKISNTNTLYKTFELDRTKYTGITNVNVSEVGEGNLSKTNTWAYHLEEDYYFGGINNEGDFEIAWGVGLDNSSATREYQISYTVVDAVKKYNDCAVLYWQFLGSDSSIDAKEITGTIRLPKNAETVDDIKVWGHVETLNGEIYVTNLNTVVFNINKYKSGNFVEVRIAMPTDMVENANRTYGINVLQDIIEEETQWANEANARREAILKSEQELKKDVTIFSAVASGILLIPMIWYIIKLKNPNKLVPTQTFEYYREKPDKNSTPADALFLYNNGVDVSPTSFGNVFSATLLNLSLKGYYKIELEKDEIGIGKTVIYKLEKDINNLQYEEKKIAIFVNRAINGKEKITITELQKYIRDNTSTVMGLIEGTKKETKNKNIIAENYDKKSARKKYGYSVVNELYCMLTIFFAMFVLPCMMFLGVNIVMIIPAMLVINIILSTLVNKKLSRLTQKGVDEREKWKGLKKYMEDFSLLDEKEVPALQVWEEFLVYATVFGIADKVIEQLKLVYPQIEQIDSFSTASYVYIMSHTDFNSSFNSAINSAISTTMSSGSGGGGGFSGGGGGGRWPEAECGGR